MKASELIFQLRYFIKEYGNSDIVISDNEEHGDLPANYLRAVRVEDPGLDFIPGLVRENCLTDIVFVIGGLEHSYKSPIRPIVETPDKYHNLPTDDLDEIDKLFQDMMKEAQKANCEINICPVAPFDFPRLDITESNGKTKIMCAQTNRTLYEKTIQFIREIVNPK